MLLELEASSFTGCHCSYVAVAPGNVIESFPMVRMKWQKWKGKKNIKKCLKKDRTGLKNWWSFPLFVSGQDRNVSHVFFMLCSWRGTCVTWCILSIFCVYTLKLLYCNVCSTLNLLVGCKFEDLWSNDNGSCLQPFPPTKCWPKQHNKSFRLRRQKLVCNYVVASRSKSFHHDPIVGGFKRYLLPDKGCLMDLLVGLPGQCSWLIFSHIS